MLKQILRNKFLVVMALCFAFALSSSYAFAREDRGGEGRGGRYHYRGGRWYRPGWFGFDVAVAALTIGAIIDALPPRYTTVVVGGAPYYYYDNVYFRPCPAGYIVVSPPAAPAPVVVMPAAPATYPQASGLETVVINVPNRDGSYTPVTLIRQGNDYIGPQGEHYPGNPSVEQLRALYGR